MLSIVVVDLLRYSTGVLYGTVDRLNLLHRPFNCAGDNVINFPVKASKLNLSNLFHPTFTGGGKLPSSLSDYGDNDDGVSV